MAVSLLIIEDDSNILLSMEFILSHAGYEVATATDGAQAWQRLCTATPPQLVILDVMLPVIDGFELARRMRADEKFRHVKILMLSARGREQEIAKGLACGADAYMTKPFASADLLQQTVTLLSG